jgi:hypothetical protein
MTTDTGSGSEWTGRSVSLHQSAARFRVDLHRESDGVQAGGRVRVADWVA